MLSIRGNRFRICSAYGEIGSPYAQHTQNEGWGWGWCFRVCSACGEIGSAYAEHTRKSVPRMLSLRANRFRVGSAYAETISSQKAKKLPIKTRFSPL